MGQLTNLFVSESYQGLLKLADSSTGLTTNLQSVQDGLGGNSPLQISQTEVNISGSLTINGQPISVDTGSLVKNVTGLNDDITVTKGDGTTSSFTVNNVESSSFSQTSISSSFATNALSASYAPQTPLPNGVVSGSAQIVDLGFATTSSVNTLSGSIATTDLGQNNRLTSLESNSGSQQLEINQKLNTSSFNSYTSSNDNKVNSLISQTGSYITETESGSFMITGSVAGDTLTFTKGNGSQFSLKVDTGSLPAGVISGSQQISNLGFATTSSVNEKLNTSSFNTYSGDTLNLINQKLDSGSFNSYTSSNNARVTSLESKTGSYATTGSNVFNGGQTISGSLDVTGTISAVSGTFTYLKTIYETSSVIFSSGSNIFGDEAGDVQTLNGTVNIPLGNVNVTGAVTASAGFKGNLEGTASYATQALSASYAPSNPLPSGIVSGSAQIVDLGFLETSSFNSYTSSNDSKVNSLISQTGSYVTETESGSFVTNVNGGLVSFEDQITITKGNGSSTIVTINNVTNADSSSFSQTSVSSSYATNALSASYVPLPSGLVSGSAQIVDLGFATTGSVDTLSGSIAVTDSAQDSRLNSLENKTGSFAITGSNIFLGNQTVDGDITLSGSYNALVVPMDNYIKLYAAPTLDNTSAAIHFYSGSGATKWLNMQPVPTSLDGDVAISEFPVNNHFMYFRMLNHTIDFEAPLKGTGSAPIETKTGFINNTSYFPGFSNERGFVNSGSMVVRGNLFNLSNNTSFNPDLYVTNSLVGQTNLIKGWGDNPTPAGVGSNQANYTGSLRITGSNNTVSLPQLRATGFGLTATHQGYISGSDNILGGNNSGIYLNTESQILPRTQGNFVGNNSMIGLTFSTSSLAGSTIANNSLYAANLTLSHRSGSVNATSNFLNGASILSTQNFVTNVRPSISSNMVANTVTLNHISSSINYGGNINNSTVVIDNYLSSSIVNNSLSINNNIMVGGTAGTGLQVFVSGSQNTNVARNITDNLIGGRSNIISSSFVSSSNSNLMSTLIYGNGLTVVGSHTPTSGGSTFLGRFNDTTSLHLAQDIVLAVGTGTAAGTRRTGLYVTSGSLVGISGSMDVKGNTTMTGSLDVNGQISSNQSSGAEGGQINLALAQTGNLLTGSISVDVYENKVRLFEAGGTNRGGYFAINEMTAGVGSKLGPLNVGSFYSTQTQSGSANVSQSINYNTTDITKGVSLVAGSQLTLADTGVYNIQFSAQILADTGADDVWFWLKKNGTNIPDTAGRVTLANNEELMAAWNYVVSANAGDYIELVWQSANGDAVLLYNGASGNIPAVTSIITTVTQIR